MAHHTLKLNYAEKPEKKFRPDVDPLEVEEGDTISFQLGIAPANSRFKITMNEPELFSPSAGQNRDTKITVLALKKPTTYHGQLFDSVGNLLFQSSEQQPGGGIRPGHP